MKIGLGLTTCNRPEYLAVCLQEIQKHTTLPYTLYVHDDTHKRDGVAYSKNQCLYNLKDSDYIILLDDDVFVKAGWLEFIIEAHEASAQGHFLFMDKNHHKFIKTWQPHSECSIDLFDDCSGVFMSITKEAFNKLGYFDSRYKCYGYEHAGYSRRIHLSKFNSDRFMMPTGLGDYLHAVDFSGAEAYGLTKQTSIDPNKKAEYIEHNDGIYHDELANWFNLYRPYERLENTL